MSKTLRTTMLGTAVLYFLLGLCMLLWPTASRLTICYVLGACLLAFGVFRVIAYFANRQVGLPLRFDFVLGAISAVLGLICLFNPNAVAAMLGFLIGLAITADSAVKLQLALELRRSRYGGWLVRLIISLATLVLGVILLFNPIAATQAITIYAGICLILDAVANLLCVFDMNKLERSFR